MTGRFFQSPARGVQIFSDRKFSLKLVGSTHELHVGLGGPDSCGQRSPNMVASRTDVHGVGGFGGRNRLAPPVGAPYGTPLKTSMPCSTVPRTGPDRVA